MQDRIPTSGYTILRLGTGRRDSSALANALKSFGAPVVELDVPDQVAREIYGHDLILLRPDMHIVWRGHTAPDDAAEVARIATGH
jgi:3-dehydroquinate dehydratase